MTRLSSILQKFLSTVRKRGLRKTIALVFTDYLFSYQRRYILTRPLPDQRVQVPTSLDIEIRRISADDVHHVKELFGMITTEELRDYISLGDYIFVAFAHGKPVAFRHASPVSRTHMPLKRFPLQAGQLWVVDTYTDPAYRGRRIASLLREYGRRYFAGLKYKDVVSSIDMSNIASLHHAQRVSYSNIQSFTYIRILFFSYLWMHRDSERKFYSS